MLATHCRRVIAGLILVALVATLLPTAGSVLAAPASQAGNCLFFTETAGGRGGFSVCDDGTARFRSAFQTWGLQKIGYPISKRYIRDGFVTQAFQKAIMQWRAESNSVVLVNVFDDLHNDGFDPILLSARQTPLQFPPGWDGDRSWAEVVQRRQALLNVRPALRQAYFSSADPLTFFGLPTSEVQDMGNHYAVRLQRSVLQEWKETVPWARAGEVTIANGGDIAKELGGLPADAVVPESGPSGSPPPPAPGPAPAPTVPAPASPTRAAIFGVEISAGAVGETAGRATEAGVTWVRYNGISWSRVEQTQGVRDWSQLATVEGELQTLASHGLQPVVIIRSTPGWAQSVAGSACSAIREDALDDFASFMGEVVARYSRPPYNVKYWELGNEPDIDPSLVQPSSGFGCWGNINDPYYGGGYYAEMLERVYPAVKSADPSAQVVIGGLNLDCDPRVRADCVPGKFLEGILRNGGGAHFDVIAYHAYMYWGPRVVDWDVARPGWDHAGGVLLGKLDLIRSVQARYGVDKPVLMNEGGLLCHPSTECAPGALRDAQANYVIRLYTRSWANGLLGSIWYTLDGPGWRQGGLLNRGGAPRPAYQAYSFLAGQLRDASYVGRLAAAGLEGYRFRKGGTELQIAWTNGEGSVSLALPAGTEAVYDKLGQPVPTSGSNINIGFEPVIIQVRVP